MPIIAISCDDTHMSDSLTKLSSSRWLGPAVALGAAGVLVSIEVLDEPGMTVGEAMVESIESILLVSIAAMVAYLFGRVSRQEADRQALLADLRVARVEGAQWRSEMTELLRGLGAAIDAQFDRWDLTDAEREVAMLMLKELSHREIGAVRDTSERTVRQQAQAIYRKANLSGRTALSAFFLEDLLLPANER